MGGDVNYSEIEQDGTLEFHGDATVFDDLVVPLISGKAATNPPTFSIFRDDGSSSVGSITPSTSQDDISSVLVVRLFRNSSNAADTYTGGAFGLSFDLHHERNTDGSRTQWEK